jgi:hypothetical protein
MATSGKSQLEVILNYKDRLSPMAPRTIRHLRDINSYARTAAKGVDLLNKSLSRQVRPDGVEAYARGLGKLRGEMRTTVRDAATLQGAFGNGFDTKGIDAAISKTRELQRESKALTRAPRSRAPHQYQPGDWMKDSDRPVDWRRQLGNGQGSGQKPPANNHGGGRLLRQAEQVDAVLQTTGQITHAFTGRVEGMERYTDEYLQLSQARQKFLARNLSPRENTEAFSAVDETVKNLRGLTHAETTETLTDLHTALGDLHHAMEALPIASKYRFGVSTLLGDKFSPEEIESQIQGGMKFLEMIGAVSDRSKMEAYFNRVQQITTATGGRVTPDEMLAMAKTGGTAVQGLSLEGLTSLTLPIQEMGGSRTGTALQTLFQNIIAGHIEQKGLAEWQRLGLLDESKVEYNKSGIVKSMRAGAIPIGTLMQESPLAFADALRDAMQRKGVDTGDPKKVIEELGALKMPRTAAELTSLMINQRSRVTKDMGLVTNAKQIDQLYGQGLESPMGQLRELNAQLVDFKAQVGKPLLEIATNFSKAFMPILQYASEYPKTAAGILVLGKSIGFVAETLTAVKTGGEVLGWFKGAGEGAEGAAEKIGEATGKAGGLRRALSSLSSNPWAITIGLTAASVFTIGEITELIRLMDEKKKADAALRESNNGNLQTIGKAREVFGQMGEPVPDIIWKQQAGGALGKLNTNNELRDALKGWTTGSFMSEFFGGVFGLHTSPYHGIFRRFDLSDEKTRDEFRNRVPELGQPEIMAEFRRLVDNWKLPADQRAALDKGLQLAFPDSFAKATQMSTDELTKLAPATTQTTDALKKISDAAPGVVGGLGEAGTAAQSFADRVNALEIKLPQVSATGAASGGAGAPEPGDAPKLVEWPAPHRRRGGAVKRGNTYVVGEEGEELFTAGADGFITPHDRAEGLAAAPDYSLFAAAPSGGHTINVEINVPPGHPAAEDTEELVRFLERKLEALAARLDETRGQLHDPRFVDGMVNSARERVAQRS